MTHEELKDMYELYVLDVLEADEKLEIAEHLARGCAECREGVRLAIQLNATMEMLPEQATPPARLRKRVLASVGATDSGARVWQMILASLSAVLAVAVIAMFVKSANDSQAASAANARLRSTLQELSAARVELAQAREIVDFLKQPETVEATYTGTAPLPPRVRAFVNPRRGVLFIASRLAEVPPGKIYEMWVLPKSGAPVAAGLFKPDAQGTAVHVLNGPIDRAQTVGIAVTVEPESGSTAPTTKPFIVATLSD